METDLLQKLGSKEITKIQLLERVEADFGLVPVLLEGTSSANASVRYACGSILMDLSGKHPNQMYPYIESFIGLLDNEHRILTWNAMAIVANLAAVDADRKFDAIFDKYYSFLSNEYMVTVANAVVNSMKIAASKPYLANRIASELLKTQNLQVTPHLTEECKLVIAERAIKTFNTLINYTQNKHALIEFAQEHQNSSRASLRKEAKIFLKKWL